MTAPKTIDEYIAQYPSDIQTICQNIRNTIRAAAPTATEKISYGLATFWEGENLIHFGVMKNHIGIYPGADGVVAFADRLTGYKTTKGAIQLPLKDPIPYGLIREITEYRIQKVKTAKLDRA